MAHTKMHANKNAQHAKKYAPYFARTGLFAAISMVSAIAVAQDTNSENSNPMEEVTVTGMRAALDKALDVKQNSNFVMDALSLEDINSTPAITIAEALVRMPGGIWCARSRQRKPSGHSRHGPAHGIQYTKRT